MKTFYYQLVVWISTCCLLNGCTLLGLHKDLEEYRGYGSVSGIVESDSPYHKPIQVLLVKPNNEDVTDNTVVNWTVMYKPGPYKFWVLPGTYMVGVAN